jgi:peptidoglycan/xylan/chitin deacetylase (PgdA/CDA1 family)
LNQRKSVAITFDDGPTRATRVILQTLSSFNVTATFFECGMNVERHPEIAREVACAGHEIGNHSHSHPNCALRSFGFIRDEFRRAQETIQAATGVTPRVLRAPYGVRWFGFRRMQQELGLQGVMWSIIGRDWRLPAAAIAAGIISRVKPGDIICLHDGRGTLENPDISQTVEAVRRIVPALMETGYHFETVTDLLCPTK